MLMVTGVAGCSNETKSNANQQESQKERDIKEADKAVTSLEEILLRPLVEHVASMKRSQIYLL